MPVPNETLAAVSAAPSPPVAPPTAPFTRSATMSSQYAHWGGSRCIDGNTGSTCHTQANGANEWLSIELNQFGIPMSVGKIRIFNRGQNQNRFGHHQIWVGTSSHHRCLGPTASPTIPFCPSPPLP